MRTILVHSIGAFVTDRFPGDAAKLLIRRHFRCWHVHC